MVLLNENKGEETKPKVQKDAVNLSQGQQIISARQVSKLAKGDNPVFLAIVRATNEDTKMSKPKKRSSARAVRFAPAHRMSKGQRRSINKSQSPKKDIITVAEREQQVLDSVPVCHREKFSQLIQKYHDIFPEQLPKGIPPKGVVEHSIKIEPGK